MTGRIRAISFDLDGTLLDGSRLPEAVAATCDAVAERWPDVDASQLVQANEKAFRAFWAEAEELWTLGKLDGSEVSLEVWRRALAACGRDGEA